MGAIKQIASITGAFRDALIAWLGDATNGIAKFFAGEVHTDKLCTTTSRGDEVCASGDQLAAILAGVSAGAPQQGGNEAPATAPASDGGSDADNSTTTTDAGNASSTSDILSPSSTEVGIEPADAPALGEGVEAPADVSEGGGSNTGSVDDTASADAPPVPQSTASEEQSPAVNE